MATVASPSSTTGVACTAAARTVPKPTTRRPYRSQRLCARARRRDAPPAASGSEAAGAGRKGG
ncbi:MAG: hypothetical protein ACRD03_09435, partial [Acidimicrobiales bacterium]